ncbi:MAG TPA: response regulator [Terriglobales bacterium]|nr:response regulator [Terriglobales bacterium]
MAESTVRILVVEDYESFRQFICATLHKEVEPQAIFEASDGGQAIELARALHPDLILLDIGLPKLNGIEAARRIRELSPKSRILFVSQESSVDIVQEAFSAGASGYVVKTDAARELAMAVKAVLRGARFVGIRFAGHGFTGPSNAATPQSALHSQERSAARHEAGFYSDDAAFLSAFTGFAGAALRAGNSVIVLATESHRNSLLMRLQKYGVDIGAAIEQGRYISLDAADRLSRFMVDDVPDGVRFLKLAKDLIARAMNAAGGEHRVAACGECAPLLWMQGNGEAAVRLERLWDELVKTYKMDTLCGYCLDNFQDDLDNHIFEQICAEHTAVYSR